MQEQLQKAIEDLTSKSKDADKACDAMQYAQAALSLTHAYVMLDEAKQRNK